MEVIADRYEVEREIGRGGMGVVLLARDTTLGRRVALKRLTLDPMALAGDEATRRFMREARLTSQLSHPCIVNLFDVLEAGNDLYLILEYYESESLSARVQRAGPLAEHEARQVGAQVAGALGYAHSEGVVHRDVKPDNILLGAKGAKLTDFGIARLAEGKQDSDTKLTQTGYYVGTPGYMSPEQIKGDSATSASDVFSVALVVYYALTGEEPFGTGAAAAVLYRIVHEPLEVSSLNVSDDLKHWLMAASAKDPGQRPDAGSLGLSLDSPAGSGAMPPSPVPVPPAPSPVPAPLAHSMPQTPPPAGMGLGAPPAGSSAPGYTPPPQTPHTPPPQTPPPPPPHPLTGPGIPATTTGELAAKSSHGAVIAVLVGVLLLLIIGIAALFAMRKPPPAPAAESEYTSPQGFSVVLPSGWTGEYGQSDRTDRLESPDGSANVFISKIGPSRDDLKALSGDALITEYVKRQLQLEGKLQLKEDIVTVDKDGSFGDYDAISFEFEVVDSASRSRYTAEMYVFSTGDSLWAVLDFAPRGSFENARSEFNEIESSFATVDQSG